jgi:hypothetical protein
MISLNVSFNSKKVIAELSNDVDQMVRQISQDLFDTIKQLTPVGETGRAKNLGGYVKKGNTVIRFPIACLT